MSDLPDDQDDRYTPEEICDAIEAMSDADIEKVRLMARYFAPRSGMSAEDLEQETFVRALGTRTCKVGVGIVGFLGGVMRSIASEEPRARKRAREAEGGAVELVLVGDYAAEGLPEPADDAPSPERAALSRVYHAAALQRALDSIGDDEELQLLAEGLFDGLRGEELEALLDTDTKGLAAAKRRLSRRLNARFPEGVSI